MADNLIKKIKISGSTTEYDLYAILASAATQAVSAQTAGKVDSVYVNESGNLEISNVNLDVATDSKVNLVSKSAIQVKPGLKDGKTDAVEDIQLDCENGTTACTEVSVKVCNGLLNKASRVSGLKINTAEVVLDNQKNATGFSNDSIDIKVRRDKWNGGVEASDVGPRALKLKARAHDIRCYDHGGIALQVAGADSANKENKIKFESDRTSNIGETAAYNGEGGKGMEFGTFNNLHTSLFTGDYRFKGDAKVYGVTRGALVESESGKIDYPTQTDDFKDILNEENSATWNQIISVAKSGGMASGYTYTAGQYINISDDHVISVTGITSGGSVDVSGKVDKTIVGSKGIAYIFNESDGGGAKFDHNDGTISYVGVNDGGSGDISAQIYAINKDNYAEGTKINVEKDKITYIKNKPTSARTGDDEIAVKGDFNKQLFRKSKNGNLEISASGLKQWDEDTKEETLSAATLDLVSDTKVAIKPGYNSAVTENYPCAISMEGENIIIPIEISKKNKYSCGSYEYSPITSLTDLKAQLPKITLDVEKNNSTIDEVKTFTSVSVSIYDLITLVNRVAALETKCTELENRINTYHPGE